MRRLNASTVRLKVPVWAATSGFLLLLAGGVPSLAQPTQGAIPPRTDLVQLQSVPASSGITIHPGDTIAVTVSDTPELSLSARVSDDGTVDLPLLGLVKVAGLSEAGAAHLIDDDYIAHGDLLRPSTTVLIREFAAKGISILGEVARPGVYSLSGPRSVLDMVALGGLNSSADTRLFIRRNNNSDQTITVSIPFDDGVTALSNDVAVYPGDRIVAPRAGMVFVLGEVTRPGGYIMQHNGALTVLQAVAAASGTTRVAGRKNVVLIRRAASGYNTTHIELLDLYKGKRPDIVLQPDDVVYIPDSSVRNFVVNAPQILAQIAGSAIYSLHP
jgi:polysaccharide export outer membrane protein